MTRPHEHQGMLARHTSAGRVGVVQIVAIELAVMAVVTPAVTTTPMTAMTTTLVALPLLLPVLARHHGRWWYEAVFAWLELRRRRRDGTRAVLVGAEFFDTYPELARLFPHLAIQSIPHRETSIGIGADDLGWFAVIALTAPDGIAVGPSEPMSIGLLVRQAGALSTVQVVTRHTPAPVSADPDSPCAVSYQELCQRLAVAYQRQTWIALRIELRDAADREGDEAGVHAALASATTRISELLNSQGMGHRVLDARGLRRALADAYGPGPYAGGHLVSGAAGESWSRWRGEHAVHLCYAVTDWPEDAAPETLTWLGAVAGAHAVCVSLAAGPMRAPGRDSGHVGGRVVVRLVASPRTVRQCQRTLRAGAGRLGIGLVRLDGELGPAVYASTPTAASHGWGNPW
ncbi:MAG TPA: type VII secretion protein EccE [Micromonosporaceae bacterium]|jgi:type VII secretion protein EccE